MAGGSCGCVSGEHYLHDLSPFVIPGLPIRWYGLAYVGGFLAGWYLLKRLARSRIGELKEEETSDFITYAAILGVMLGGRLGYVLFYLVPEAGWSALFGDPLVVLRVWEGGMASHGGILGLTLFVFFYARKRGYNWAGIGDNLVSVAPLGVFFGRLANFINGELYGKPASVGWAMKFPEEMERVEIWAEVSRRLPQFPGPMQVKAAMHREPEVRAVLEEVLTPRHPSQLYQAGMEGLALFLMLFLVRIRFPKLGYGVITGMFFVGYAIFRILGEIYREPDYGSANILGLQKGQFYSVFMIAVGVAFLVYGFTRGRKLVERSRGGPTPVW